VIILFTQTQDMTLISGDPTNKTRLPRANVLIQI